MHTLCVCISLSLSVSLSLCNVSRPLNFISLTRSLILCVLKKNCGVAGCWIWSSWKDKFMESMNRPLGRTIILSREVWRRKLVLFCLPFLFHKGLTSTAYNCQLDQYTAQTNHTLCGVCMCVCVHSCPP